MNDPLISVVTVCKNSSSSIQRTIESVISQKNGKVEYIVIDGSSEDGTCEIIRKYLPQIDYFKSENDAGISEAFNKGIRQARGEFVFLVSADDWLPENILEDFTSWIVNEGSISDVYFGDVLVFGLEGGAGFRVSPDKTLNSIQRGPPVKHGGCIIRKSAYEKFGDYCESYKLAMDYELVFRFMKQGAVFQYVPMIMACISEGGINQRLRNQTRKEVFEISLSYGVPFPRAIFYLVEKSIRDCLRALVAATHLLPWVRKLRSIISAE